MQKLEMLVKRAFRQASVIQGKLQALYRGRVSKDVEQYVNEILEEEKILKHDLIQVLNEVMEE